MKKFFKLSQKPVTQDGSPKSNSAPFSVGLQPRLDVLVPPVPHPTPYYRIAVLATKSALLLRPIIPGVLTPHSYVRVSWGNTFELEEVSASAEDLINNEPWEEAAVVFGVLGCLNLTTDAYMLVITAKSDVGHFLDSRNDIYGIKSVSAIPMQESRARTVINSIATKYSHVNLTKQESTIQTSDPACDPSDLGGVLDNESSQRTRVKFADNHDIKVMSPLLDSELRPSSPTPSAVSSATSGASSPMSTEGNDMSSVAKAVASRLSFWDRLSRRQSVRQLALSDERPRLNSEGDTLNDANGEPAQVLQDILEATSPEPTTLAERQSELDQKILRQIIKEFTKGVMFFAYNLDITTSLQHKQHELSRLRRKAASHTKEHADGTPDPTELEHCDVLAEPCSALPLWRRVTKQFWWNEHMLQPFIDAGLHSYILPIMQGFVQISSFHVPREPEASETGKSATVDYILISRRSRDRAGLRYQRRGVDDDANAANFVETESIVRLEREGRTNVFSYIQIRGSIPLFWTQSGYNLKPPPVLSTDRTHDQHFVALRRHFAKTISRYGPHTIVNLAEQRGKEAVITRAYCDYVSELGSKDVRYVEYDFHDETKGMHYEKLAILVKKLSKTFDTQGFTWFSGDVLMSEQKAVFRVNCIDCLDRTNVVQSAFAKHLLEKQLGAVALLNSPASGRSELDIVFNDLWANNGDAISRAYAGTSALKGDYTRTGKRDLTGMLNDGMNSLARMYASTFSDWFSQAVIDFMLGNRTLSVFSEFLERLQSTDPRERLRTEVIRTEAIADSVSRVLSEGERLLCGWTLLSPAEFNTRFSDKLEEKILLLSVQALYVVSYDYTLEKVVRYLRIPLDQITKLTKGEYILSPLEEGSRDPMQNYGFVVHYLTSGEITRVTSYSLRNSVDMPTESGTPIPTLCGRPSQERLASKSLSRILNDAANERDSMLFVAFKALPVDPIRSRRTTGSFEEAANDLAWAKSCKEAVDMMVDTIFQATLALKDGESNGCLITSGPIVSLEDAQKATPVMAKMEYGIKRLLWLGS